MCKAYVTFSRDKTISAFYDVETGSVIGDYKVSYARNGWQLGTHQKDIDDDNETVLRNVFDYSS